MNNGSISDELVELGSELVSLGLVRGTAGNISIMDTMGKVACSPSGVSLGTLSSDQVSILDRTENGDLAPVSGPKATKETAIHSAIYKRLMGWGPGSGVVIHTHSFHAVQASCLQPWSSYSAIPPYAPYLVMKVGNCPLIPYRHPGDPELGALMDNLGVQYRAALLAHHGLVVGAPTVQDAITAAIELEEGCRLAVSLSMVPDAHPLDEVQASELAARNRVPWG